MKTVYLIDWKNSVNSELLQILQSGGYEVEVEYFDSNIATKRIKQWRPDFLVINYAVMAQSGRLTAKYIKEYYKTEKCRLVMVDGEPDDLEKLTLMELDAIRVNKQNILAQMKGAK